MIELEGPLGKSDAVNRELVSLEKELSTLRKNGTIDPFGLYVYGLVLKEKGSENVARSVLAESVNNYPWNWSAWSELHRVLVLNHHPAKKSRDAAIMKMVATLDDPFTWFLEPKKFKSLRAVWNKNTLTGVGLSIGYPKEKDKSSSGLVVVSAAPGSPAYRAGILSGDMIVAIDDRSTESLEIYDAAERLQVPEGRGVELIVRYGSETRIGVITDVIFGMHDYYASVECNLSRQISVSSDIHGFGVMVLEIVSGMIHHHSSKKGLDLIVYAWKLWNEEKPLYLMEASRWISGFSKEEVLSDAFELVF